MFQKVAKKDPCLVHKTRVIRSESIGFRRITLFSDDPRGAFVVPNGHFSDTTKECLCDTLFIAWDCPSLTYDGKVLFYEQRHN